MGNCNADRKHFALSVPLQSSDTRQGQERKARHKPSRLSPFRLLETAPEFWRHSDRAG